MSNWTHVAGIIRVDAIDRTGLDFDELIGKECLWESSKEIWDDFLNHPNKYLPMGSEGSLQKSIWVNPDRSSLDAYMISIFGDLRDHDSPEDIIKWFKEKCELLNKERLLIRNAVITAENEVHGTKTYTYNPLIYI